MPHPHTHTRIWWWLPADVCVPPPGIPIVWCNAALWMLWLGLRVCVWWRICAQALFTLTHALLALPYNIYELYMMIICHIYWGQMFHLTYIAGDEVKGSCSLMDKASDFESEDCRFESCHDRATFFPHRLGKCFRFHIDHWLKCNFFFLLPNNKCAARIIKLLCFWFHFRINRKPNRITWTMKMTSDRLVGRILWF